MRHENKFDEMIGKAKVTDVLPLLNRVAEENNLKLNRAKDFSTARSLLVSRYTVKINE